MASFLTLIWSTPLPLLDVGAAFGWSRRLRRQLVAGRPGF